MMKQDPGLITNLRRGIEKMLSDSVS
jgi:hypothetical protein